MSDQQYIDDDFVYVNPSKRAVLGKVEWQPSGNPKKMEKKLADDDEEEETTKERKRRKKKQYYPWGTYRTMKKLFRVEGKEKEIENYKPLEEAMGLALRETYWD
ncbi:MAG: hypothetical protein UY87_C0026G0019 [Candidatus Peribacteria bacterium GW2011_GWC2_54_8]|nr:MAG: hypothetical protein UY87_C0026G0019 [Candidatus Peribacteria bacterium GW2011_GWC2_54_8]